MKKQYSYIGKGTAYIRLRGSTDPRVPLGNASKVAITVDEDAKPLKDFQSSGGGNLDKVTRINSVGIEIDLSNLSPENLAIGMRGSVSSVATVTTIDDEEVSVAVGGLSILMRIPDPTKPFTLKTASGSSGSELIDGSDYERTPAGFILNSESKVAQSGHVFASYTPMAEDVMEALVNSGKEYELFFEGLNEAREDAPVFVDVWRIKFSPSGCDLVGDDFGSLSLKAEVMKDPTKTGVGISKFFKARLAKLGT